MRNPDLEHPIEHLNFSFSFSEVNPKVQHLDSIFNFLSNIPTYFHSHSVYKGIILHNKRVFFFFFF